MAKCKYPNEVCANMTMFHGVAYCDTVPCQLRDELPKQTNVDYIGLITDEELSVFIHSIGNYVVDNDGKPLLIKQEREESKMKKLFISVPMKGRTEDNIKKSMEKMHKIAEIIFDTELEVIDSYVDEESPKGANPPIFYLGKSIEKIAEADYFIGIPYSDVFNGCEIETNVARRYKICSVEIEFWRELMPDVLEIEEKYWDNFKEENK